MDEPAGLIPRPGELLGWVIVFGPKRDLVSFVKALDGETAALLKASHLENAVILRAVVG